MPFRPCFSHLLTLTFHSAEKKGFRSVALNAAFSVIMFEAFVFLVVMGFRFAVLHLNMGANWQNPYLVQARASIVNSAAGFKIEEIK